MPEETIQKMRDAWTPERRQKQSKVAKNVWEVHGEKLRSREITPQEAERLRTLSKGRVVTEEERKKKRAAWTPERRAAQAARCAERNRLRASAARVSKLPQHKTVQ